MMVVVLACLMIVGCDTRRPDSADGPGDPPMLANEAQCEAFARGLDTSLVRGDSAALVAAIDDVTLTDRIVGNMNLNKSDRDSLRGLVNGLVPALVAGWVRANSWGSSMRYLRTNWNDGSPRAIFRHVTFAGELEYVEFILCTDTEGRVRVCDQYNHYGDGLLSPVVQRYVRSATTGFTERLFRGLLRVDESQTRWADSLRPLLRHERNEEVLRSYDTIPAADRDRWNVQAIRLRAAKALGDSLYKPALAYAYGLFKDKPGYELLALRYLRAFGKYDSALAAIERIEKSVGGDPYLDVERGWIHGLKEDLETGRKYVARYVAADSSVTFPYALLFDILIHMKQFGPATDCFAVLDRRMWPGFIDQWLNGLEYSEDYRRSPEYRAYRQTHR